MDNLQVKALLTAQLAIVEALTVMLRREAPAEPDTHLAYHKLLRANGQLQTEIERIK